MSNTHLARKSNTFFAYVQKFLYFCSKFEQLWQKFL